MEKYNFQYCQKIVVYSKDEKSVLLCKRKSEADFDETFSFIGGKMEIADKSIIEGLRREKNEEVGENFKIKIYPAFTTNIFFIKNDGRAMILPHYYAVYDRGDIQLNEEYSEFKWVPLKDIAVFEPKINTIPEILDKFAILKKAIIKTEFIEI
jgi:ADP-ribose pyrophosphatase YjhB (NUDIX family)